MVTNSNRIVARYAAWVVVSFFWGGCSICTAQIPSQGAEEATKNVREQLTQRISLDLRDAQLLEALFTIRDATNLNLVVGNEVTGTVNAAYDKAPIHQILDSLLIPRGYGYRVVGGSVAVVPLEQLGDQLPLFETAVIRLNSATASELLSTVESLLSPEGRVHVIPSSNSLVVMDYPTQITTVRSQLASLEQATEEHRQQTAQVSSQPSGAILATTPDGTHQMLVRVLSPQYITSAILESGIRPLLSENGRAAALEREDKLVVTDDAEHLQRILDTMALLDRPRPQVRIWALIYDCGLEDIERLGTNWRSSFQGRGLDADGNPTQSAVLDTVTAGVAGGTNGLLTLTSVNRYSNLSTVIQALNSADDSRLLADPNVVVMNHESAEIEIVTEIPFQQLTEGLEGGTIGTTEFREAGVTLNVTPHISQDGSISMVINPRFSLLTGFSEPDNAPIIDRRETTTTVRVQNQQTLVLGGLRQRNRISERSLIPKMGKLPVIGRLFRHRSNTVRESELLVFITPEIVYPDYIGTEREACIANIVKSEIEQAPTDPVPFGMPAVRAEDRAREAAYGRKRLHKRKHHKGRRPRMKHLGTNLIESTPFANTKSPPKKNVSNPKLSAALPVPPPVGFKAQNSAAKSPENQADFHVAQKPLPIASDASSHHKGSVRVTQTPSTPNMQPSFPPVIIQTVKSVPIETGLSTDSSSSPDSEVIFRPVISAARPQLID